VTDDGIDASVWYRHDETVAATVAIGYTVKDWILYLLFISGKATVDVSLFWVTSGMTFVRPPIRQRGRFLRGEGPNWPLISLWTSGVRLQERKRPRKTAIENHGFPRSMLSNEAVERLAILHCVRNVHVSNLGPETDFHGWDFSDFPLFLRANLFI
jgi:hypothetical protein